MKDNDLSDAPTPRYWVLADVVFTAVEKTDLRKMGWFRKREVNHVTYTPDIRTMSVLWQWSARMGVRLELIFHGDFFEDTPQLWDALDKSSANPFSDYIEFETINDVVGLLPYRPDLRGVIDIPERAAYYGGLGLTMANLR